MPKKYLFFISFIVLFFQFACATDSTDSNISTVLEAEHNFIEGSMEDSSARLNVYDRQGHLMHSELLSLTEDGSLLAPAHFNLVSGKTYWFVYDFASQVQGQALSYAYALKEQRVESEFVAIHLVAEDYRYINREEILPLGLNIPLPNLDSDADGVSNFSELKDRSNPLDPESVPEAPKVFIQSSIVVD